MYTTRNVSLVYYNSFANAIRVTLQQQAAQINNKSIYTVHKPIRFMKILGLVYIIYITHYCFTYMYMYV